MQHLEKQKLARKLSGIQSGHFQSPEWESRKQRNAKKLIKNQKLEQPEHKLKMKKQKRSKYDRFN